MQDNISMFPTHAYISIATKFLMFSSLSVEKKNGCSTMHLIKKITIVSNLNYPRFSIEWLPVGMLNYLLDRFKTILW